MTLKSYKATMAKRSFGVDKSGLMFAAGLLIVAIIGIILNLALGMDPNMPLM
jgi:hypothetical protein